jgi:hypothetical protein
LNNLPGLELLSEESESLSGVPVVLTDCTTPWALVTVVVIVPSELVTDVEVVALEELLAPPPPPPPAPLAAPAPPAGTVGAVGVAAEIGEAPPPAPLMAGIALMTLLLN